MRKGRVFVKGVFAGVLSELDSRHFVFEYAQDYLQDNSLPAVCLAMPKKQQRYESSALFPFFSNMISEGHNRKMQSRFLHIDEDDDFGILLATAQYDTIGAVTVTPF